MNVKAVRELAEKFDEKSLEVCIDQQIRSGSNDCYSGESQEECVDSLSKASYIRCQMDKGISVTEAVRNLAQTIRSLELKK